MSINLRKGMSSVYLQYDNTGESMGAKLFTAAIQNGVGAIAFEISPVDSNQKSDEDHLHEKALRSVTIDDDHIVTNFANFFQGKEITGFQVHILTRGKHLKFNAMQK